MVYRSDKLAIVAYLVLKKTVSSVVLDLNIVSYFHS